MAYKAPLPMRIFHYILWAFMLLLVAWFLIIPTFLRVTAPKPTRMQELSTDPSSSNTLGLNAPVQIQQPTNGAVSQ